MSMKGYHHSKIAKEKIGDAIRGKKNPKLSRYRTGFKLSKETKIKIGKALSGSKNHFWKGGKSFEKYPVDWTKTLKRAVRERDNYICQLCNQYGNVVHHIDYNKLNCNPLNLITLCNSCHRKTNQNRNYWTNYFNS